MQTATSYNADACVLLLPLLPRLRSAADDGRPLGILVPNPAAPNDPR